MDLIQNQTQRLSQLQLQNVDILQMTTLELAAYVQNLALENPLVEPEESATVSENLQKDDFLSHLRWLEENDRQNRFYYTVNQDELDPLSRIGTDGGLKETLVSFLSRQLQPLGLERETALATRYLIACLDDDGYLRIPLEEIALHSGIPFLILEKALTVLHSLEPAGVGAMDLSQCLALQLERINETGPALAIARGHLELLARGHLRAIAQKLGVSIAQVQEAAHTIRGLDPHPGNVFQPPAHVSYVLPDIFVEADGAGHFTAVKRQGEGPVFHIDRYYLQLLEQSEDRDVREYLSDKLRQAENVLWAVGQRESTLIQCAQVICDRQADFFRKGPGVMAPLRLSEVADTLGLHESTVCRAVRGKYLQCVYGVYPLSYFFSRPVAGAEGTAISGNAARTLLRQIIDSEDKRCPLSDEKLSQHMRARGCPVSRRTVTKYRNEMEIMDAAGRRLP